MQNRKANFYAGPSALPYPVLLKLEKSIVDYRNMGLSLIETSHRSSEYDGVHSRAIELLKELLSIPDNFHVLFLGGGATLQFSMVPMNLLEKDKTRKLGVKSRRKKAGWGRDCLLTVPGIG